VPDLSCPDRRQRGAQRHAPPPFKHFAETIPVRRMGQAHETGDLCAYLCSRQAGYLTGQTIVVDGGINRSI
jgi:NAD(P)-dependent dehydrogenase (short-subunit alcohol dehydrogenase family)